LSRLLDFYRGQDVHPLRYTIEEMWTWDGRRVETLHNFIQWLFPLDVPSANSFKAPILTKEEIAEFKTDPELRRRLMESLRMMLRYYGFQFADDGSAIEKAKDFETRSGWLYPENHNYLRISRILNCLVLLGFSGEARMFFEALREIYRTHRRYIGEISWGHWCRAVGEVERK
jgi:hypothetical protein